VAFRSWGRTAARGADSCRDPASRKKKPKKLSTPTLGLAHQALQNLKKPVQGGQGRLGHRHAAKEREGLLGDVIRAFARCCVSRLWAVMASRVLRSSEKGVNKRKNGKSNKSEKPGIDVGDRANCQ
jgi:hypothetical protein